MSDLSPQLGKRSELAEALWRFRSAFVGVAAFSALINLRPHQKNLAMEIQDPEVRKKVEIIVRRLLKVE